MFKKLLRWISKLYPNHRNIGKLNTKLNHKKDDVDERDYVIESKPSSYLYYTLPINPYKYVKNQGSVGSCASHAMCTAIEILNEIKLTQLRGIETSERFHYWWARQNDFYGTFPYDSGMSSRTMLKVAHKIGMSPEKLCVYDVDKFNEKPGMFAMGFAHWFKIKSYHRLNSIEDITSTLESNKPVLLGLYVTNSFIDFSDTIMDSKKSEILGGHEVVVVGYDSISKNLFCINSWGRGYKCKGCMVVPYDYYERYKIDAWTIEI